MSSFRTTVFKHRKAAAKRKEYSFLCVWGGKENNIMILNDSAKKKQEKKYKPGVMDCVGML